MNRSTTMSTLPLGFQALNRTQFLGALNDNLFKLLVILSLLQARDLGPSQVAALAGGLFVLPFLVLSPLAGRLADRYSKSLILKLCKGVEVGVMAVGLIGFLSGQAWLLAVAVFLTAAQSALFSPAKYGIVPELVDAEQLSRANGRLEAFTYLAIIAGTALATVLPFWLGSFAQAGAVCLLVALLGLWASLRLPNAESADRQLVGWQRELAQVRVILRRDRDLRLTVIASATFLLLAAFVQLNLIPYGLQNLGLASHLSSALFLLMALGITIGAIVAGRLSPRLPEMGLVPIGAAGLLLALLGLGANPHLPVALGLLILLGVAGGLFIVPLHTFLQFRAPQRYRGRLLAVSSWLGWWGVLAASALVAAVDTGLGWTPADGFLLVSLLALVILICTLRYLAAILLRLVAQVMIHGLYRLQVAGTRNLPATGSALVVANHVSYIDALVLLASQPRRIRFLMEREIFSHPFLRPLCRLMGVIPISSKDNPRRLARSLKEARQALDDGQVVAIFAEGALTRNGQLGTFRPGFERIVRGSDHPIVPVYLDGLWGSIFSYSGGRVFGWPKVWRRTLAVRFGEPLAAKCCAQTLRRAVEGLACEQQRTQAVDETTLASQYVDAARRHWRQEAVADSQGQPMTHGQLLTAAVALGRSLPQWEKGALVPILLPPSMAGVVANLAVTLRGQVPVNLNYTLSKEAFADCLKQCGTNHVLTVAAMMERLPAHLPKIDPLMIDGLTSHISRHRKAVSWLKARLLPARWWLPRQKGTAQAALLFSSGSTGTPKGICLSHRNLLANLDSLAQVFDLRDDDRLCGILPLFHALGFTGTLWLPLLKGVAVTYHPNPLDARTVGQLVARDRCSLLLATPTFLQGYLKRVAPERFESLRWVMTGAEKLRTAVADAFEQRFGLRPLEGYGATELAPVATVNVPGSEIGGLYQEGSREGSVGRPLPGVEIDIRCTDTDQPLPIGEEGLIHVRGANVMQGYLGRPDLTDEVVQNGWYRTGDLGRVDGEGFLYITDRLNRFSKIAGEMVPHGAIEEALLQGRMTDQPVLAVTAVPDPKRGEKLVVLYTEMAGQLEEIFARATARLPNLWQPTREAFVHVEELPVLGSGKVDIKGLRKLALAALGGNE